MKNETFIISSRRTPIGGFLGKLSLFSAVELGTLAIDAVLKDVKIQSQAIHNVFMGNVLSANLGQSPARQAAIQAGLHSHTDATTINKVCSSGMKAITLGTQQVELGQQDLVMAGGMESMSNVPHYFNMRNANKFGNKIAIDGILKDGLTDAFEGYHMGNAAESTVRKFSITREQQDEYALRSYQKAQEATLMGKFQNEIIPVANKANASQIVLTEDEDIYKLKVEKVGKLAPSFEKNGTITAANASNLNDGASAMLLASHNAINLHQLVPKAKIIAYADAAQEPKSFSTAPSIAIRKVLDQANLSIDDIDYFEINEAYASVVLANQYLLKFNLDIVNIYGGAVALGHPIGASGARIVGTLLNVLIQEKGRYGIAAICNGGGGATAILIENVNY